MANIGGQFDSSQVDPTVAFEPLPKGKYTVIIIESEMKPNSKNTGRFLELVMEVVEGEYKGRKLYDRLNLENQNATAVKIARGTLSAICRATGVAIVQDSVQLHNLPMVADVRCKKRPDNDEMSNEVKGYERRGAATTPVAANAGNTPAWLKK